MLHRERAAALQRCTVHTYSPTIHIFWQGVVGAAQRAGGGIGAAPAAMGASPPPRMLGHQQQQQQQMGGGGGMGAAAGNKRARTGEASAPLDPALMWLLSGEGLRR